MLEARQKLSVLDDALDSLAIQSDNWRKALNVLQENTGRGFSHLASSVQHRCRPNQLQEWLSKRI